MKDKNHFRQHNATTLRRDTNTTTFKKQERGSEVLARLFVIPIDVEVRSRRSGVRGWLV